MKKKIVIFGIVVLIALGSIIGYFVKNYYENLPKKLPDGTVVYNFLTQSQPKASEILYEYVYNYYSKYFPSILEVYDISKDNILAFEYDLNDDGNKEIIGYIDSAGYRSRNGYSLDILQKTNKEAYYNKPYVFKINNTYYDNISTILGFETGSKILILPTKIDGYKKIILSICVSFPSIKENCEIYYTDDNYRWVK